MGIINWPNSAKTKLTKKQLDQPKPTEENSQELHPLTPNTISQEQETMSKPSSYLGIKEYTFTSKSKDKTEPVLFWEGDVILETYNIGAYGTGQKPITLTLMKEIVKEFKNDGPIESAMMYTLGATKGYNCKELVKLLKENKITALDFCSWLSEQKELEEVTKERATGGTRVTSDSVKLASIINKMADMEKEGAEPNLEMRLSFLEALMTEETKAGAIKHLKEKLEDKNYGWNKTKTIKISKDVDGKKKMVDVANPAYGQVSLKTRAK